MMHHAKQDALIVQILGSPAMAMSLAGTDGGRPAGVALVLGIALELSRDGAALALKSLINLGDRELLMQQ